MRGPTPIEWINDYRNTRALLFNATRDEVIDALRANLAAVSVITPPEPALLLNHVYELYPIADALYRALLHDAADAMSDYAISPYYSDSDTDFQPAIADQLADLVMLRANDDYTALVTFLLALVTCDTSGLKDTDALGVHAFNDPVCTHERADFAYGDDIAHLFLDYDDCPNMRD